MLVVPGPVGIAQYRGSNALIRDGAQPVLDAEEVLACVLPGENARHPRPPYPEAALPPDAVRILARLDEGPADVDALARELAISPERLAPILPEFELEGHLVWTGARVARTC